MFKVRMCEMMEGKMDVKIEKIYYCGKMWTIIDYSTKYFDNMLNLTIEYCGLDNAISNRNL